MNLSAHAIDLSLKSPCTMHQHGAVLVKNGEIVGSGYNDQSKHAEVRAIDECLQRLLRHEKESKGPL